MPARFAASQNACFSAASRRSSRYSSLAVPLGFFGLPESAELEASLAKSRAKLAALDLVWIELLCPDKPQNDVINLTDLNSETADPLIDNSITNRQTSEIIEEIATEMGADFGVQEIDAEFKSALSRQENQSNHDCGKTPEAR